MFWLNAPSSNSWVKDEMTREIKKYFDLNNHKNTTHHNVWDIAKVVHRYEFIASNISLKKYWSEYAFTSRKFSKSQKES